MQIYRRNIILIREIKRKKVPGEGGIIPQSCKVHGKRYINQIFEDFTELHGDRCFGDDGAVIGGLQHFAVFRLRSSDSRREKTHGKISGVILVWHHRKDIARHCV